MKTHGVGDIPSSERFIGTDPLWQEDPAARAAYSENPAFKDGADIAAVPFRPYNPLLVQPEIAEALEQVHRVRHSGNGNPNGLNGENGERPIDSELAAAGLAWLSDHLTTDSPLHRTVNNQYGIFSDMEARRQEALARKEESRAQFQAERERQEAEKQARETHEKRCLEEMAAAVDKGQSFFEDVDFSDVVGLASHLYSREQPDGTIAVETTKRFRKAVRVRVDTYLADPGLMVEDFRAVMVLQSVADAADMSGLVSGAESSSGHGGMETVRPYADTVEAGLVAALDESLYPDFTDEIMDRWLGLFDGLDPEYQADPATDRHEDNRNLIVSAILAGRGNIVANSLLKIARRDPADFIDRLHKFASKGLETQNLAKRQFALHVGTQCLNDPLAYHELMRGSMAATFADPVTGPKAIRQAIDLSSTLEKLGAYNNFERKSIRSLSHAEIELVEAIYPAGFMFASLGDSRVADSMSPKFGQAIKNFKRSALTAEGRSRTLYGRLFSV